MSQTLLDFNGARAAAAAAAAAFGGGAGHDAAAQAAAARFINDGGVGAALAIDERAPLRPAQSRARTVGVTGLILAGMMVFFMFFGASNVARTILTEDAAGTLPRLLTTPTPPGTILGGKFSSVFLTVTVQAVVLLVAGRVLFGIDWGRLDAVVLLTLVGAAVASGLALLVISVVRTPAQAGAIGAGVYLVLALLGGNFTGTATTERHLRPSCRSSRRTAGCCGAGTRRCTAGSVGDVVAAAARAARLRERVLRRRGAALQAAVRVSRIWTLARKDLLETRRDRLSALFIIVMPLAFTTFFGLLFGGGSDACRWPSTTRTAGRRRSSSWQRCSARTPCASCSRAPPTSSRGWPTAGRPRAC